MRSESVEIRGTVQPRGAHVQVLGREVAVDGGSFRAEVPLEPGANLIDVSADARGRRPDFAVARLVREVRLPVPDLVGADADTAQEQLEGLGLTVRDAGRRRLLRPDPARRPEGLRAAAAARRAGAAGQRSDTARRARLLRTRLRA